MALDLGLTTHQLLSTLDGVVSDKRTRTARLGRCHQSGPRCARGRGRLPHLCGGPSSLHLRPHRFRGVLGSRPPPEVPGDWVALFVDGSHIDVDRHLPLRCHLINLGGCAITYGKDPGCQLFSEPTRAVEDADLYLPSPDGTRGETLIAGPVVGALRTVREVARLADAVESRPDDRPALALLDGTLARIHRCDAAGLVRRGMWGRERADEDLMPMKWTMRSVSPTPGRCLRLVVAALGAIISANRRQKPSGAQPGR